MDNDLLNFGSEAAGGTPDADSILAQPPLQGESPLGQEESSSVGGGQATESTCNTCSVSISATISDTA